MREAASTCLPIDTHNDMDFSLIHGEVNAVKELFPAYRYVEILHAK